MVIFRWNSGCFAEQKTLGILFHTLPPKRKNLGIPFCGTKIEANSWNSVPNHSAEEKTTQNKMRQLKISKIQLEKMTFDVRTNHFVKLFWLFCKTIFFRRIPFHSIQSIETGSSLEL